MAVGIDQVTIDKIRQYLEYEEPREEQTDLMEMFKVWWAKRAVSSFFKVEGRTVWKQRWVAIVERERRNLTLQSRSRCPTCGAKLAVRRCLACDLRGGVL
ncbi:MAG: hypothetical protein EBR82_61300 [Caulobacteraceae bacterium]|nr:hypothetical protein [Caulobacteraceae bacterium]